MVYKQNKLKKFKEITITELKVFDEEMDNFLKVGIKYLEQWFVLMAKLQYVKIIIKLSKIIINYFYWGVGGCSRLWSDNYGNPNLACS